jgi:hypothetical protein
MTEPTRCAACAHCGETIAHAWRERCNQPIRQKAGGEWIHFEWDPDGVRDSDGAVYWLATELGHLATPPVEEVAMTSTTQEVTAVQAQGEE